MLDISKTSISLQDRFIGVTEDCYGPINGTHPFDVDDLVDDELEDMGSKYGGWSDFSYVRSRVDSDINTGPTMLSLSDHSVVVVGRAKYYTVVNEQYFDWGWKWRRVTKVDTFFIINEGWSNQYGTSYLDTSKVPDQWLLSNNLRTYITKD